MTRLYVLIAIILVSAAVGAQSSATLNAASPPSSPTSPGTQAPSPLVVQGVTGGADSATGGTAGQGSTPSITTGDGGAGTGTNTTGGQAGNLLITTGSGGSSTGTAANSSGGNLVITLGQQGTGGSGAAGASDQVQITASTPSTQAGAGLSVGTLFNVAPVTGGATTGTGTTAGTGSGVSILTGAGGSWTGSGTNVVGGAGGSVTITTGIGGASNGNAVNANGGDVSFVLGAAGSGGTGTAGRNGRVIFPDGTANQPTICPANDPLNGLCFFWTGTDKVIGYSDLGGAVAGGLDDQALRIAHTGAIRFTNGNISGNIAFNNGGIMTADTTDGTLTLCKGSDCDGLHGHPATGSLNLTKLNVFGATSGSATLSASATGGTLNLGSTSAMVDSSGDYSGTSATFTTPADSSTVPLTISQGATNTVFPAAALSIAQGGNNGATNVPALNIAQTWNNSSLAGPVFSLAVTNTSSATNAKLMQVFAGSSGTTLNFQVDTSGIVKSNTGFGTTVNTGNTQFCGGTCSGSASAVQGGGLFQGMDNSSNNSAAGAGFGILRGGMLTNGTPNASAVEGVVEVGEGYLKGSAIAAIGDVVCGTGTAFTVTDCPHGTSTTNIIGIATFTSNPISVISYGLAPVKLDNTGTIGHNVCMSTSTDGQGHDNGSAACALGQAIGVIVAVSGNITVMEGAGTGSVAMSTTPLVQLHISQ